MPRPSLPSLLLLPILLMLFANVSAADIVPRTAPVVPPIAYGQHDALAATLAAGKLRCGVITAAEDYSIATTHGDLSLFGAALCRAVAAALFGHPDAVSLTGYPEDAHGMTALRTGAIDLLLGVTPDAANALPNGLAFAPDALFDAQSFLVNRASGITRPEQLAGKLVCFITGTSQEQRLNDWQAATGVRFYAHDFQERGEMEAALVTGHCAAIADDDTALADTRVKFHGRVGDYAILDQAIAIDAWAPAVRAGEVRLVAVVTDVLAALIQGEALGITQAGAAAPHPGADMLLGPTPGIASTLSMPDGWARRAIAAGGNYAEIYDHTLGALHLPRGHDALWSAGGMLAPPTLR